MWIADCGFVERQKKSGKITWTIWTYILFKSRINECLEKRVS